MNTVLEGKATNYYITFNNHVWEPYVKEKPNLISNLPPPFDAFGDATWKLIECKQNCPTLKKCISTTLTIQTTDLKVLLGVSQNKKNAKQFRDDKKKVKEIIIEEAEEEEVVSSSSSSSASSEVEEESD